MRKTRLQSLSRRKFVQSCVSGVAAVSLAPILGCKSTSGERRSSPNGPASHVLPLNQDWLFGGKLDPAALLPAFDDSRFSRVTLPHCATKLSWQNWAWEDWQAVWCYRRHFSLPATFKRQRLFLEFDGVMVGAEPTINAHALPKHLGGYLPFHYEITERHAPGVVL